MENIERGLELRRTGSVGLSTVERKRYRDREKGHKKKLEAIFMRDVT
jgi:hypothetical protein